MSPVPPEHGHSVEALLFDLGGVLIQIDFGRALEHWAKCGGCAAGDLRGKFVFEETLARYERGEIEACEYFERLRGMLGIDIPDEAFDEGWNSIFLDKVAGIDALLESVHGRVPLFVFSNTNVDHARAWSSRFEGLLRPFDRVFVSHDLGKRKPTPEAFHAVAQAMDVPPERILFFDDTLANVEGALAVGMPAVHVRSLEDIRRAISQCRWVNHTGD